MFMRFPRTIPGLVAGLLLSGTMLAAQTPADAGAFTARAVQTMPDGTEQTGRIMKSGQNMRLETTQNGVTSIQIMRGGDGLAYYLDPQTRTYFEIRDPGVAQAVAGATSPCPPEAQAQAMQIRCTQTGSEKVSGVTVQRWEVQGPQEASPSIILWDSGRRRALGQTWPDGATLTMAFQAMEEVSGRNAEHWTSVYQAPGQPAVYGNWWFDAQLIVVLREDLPGGVTRSLTDIVTGPVDPALFLPPADWQQVAPPQQGQTPVNP